VVAPGALPGFAALPHEKRHKKTPLDYPNGVKIKNTATVGGTYGAVLLPCIAYAVVMTLAITSLSACCGVIQFPR